MSLNRWDLSFSSIVALPTMYQIANVPEYMKIYELSMSDPFAASRETRRPFLPSFSFHEFSTDFGCFSFLFARQLYCTAFYLRARERKRAPSLLPLLFPPFFPRRTGCVLFACRCLWSFIAFPFSPFSLEQRKLLSPPLTVQCLSRWFCILSHLYLDILKLTILSSGKKTCRPKKHGTINPLRLQYQSSLSSPDHFRGRRSA